MVVVDVSTEVVLVVVVEVSVGVTVEVDDSTDEPGCLGGGHGRCLGPGDGQ